MAREPEPLEVPNADESILVLVDEGAPQPGGRPARGAAGRPANCAALVSTGTPILLGDKKRTHEIFGEFIDRYTIREAEADGAIVPILYEGRTARAPSRTTPTSMTSSRTCSAS